MKKLLKSIRLNRQYPRVLLKPEVEPGFSKSHEHGSFEKQRKMDSLTSKTLRMKKLFVKRGFHFIIFAVNVLINSSVNQHLDLFKVNVLDQNHVSLICPLALENSLPMSYCASKSVQPFGFCRYISSWKSRCLKLCLKKHGENLKIFFHFEVPQLRHPSTEWTQKVLGTTISTSDHVCKISFRLLNIFEKLWHGERIALDREEEKQKKTKKSPE